MLAEDTISRSWMFMDVRGISPTNPRLLFQQHHRSSCASDCSDLQRPKLQLMGIFFHSDVGSNAKNIPKYPTTEVNPTKVKPLGFFIHWGLCQWVKDSPGSRLRSYPSPNPRNLVHMEPHGALECFMRGFLQDIHSTQMSPYKKNSFSMKVVESHGPSNYHPSQSRRWIYHSEFWNGGLHFTRPETFVTPF